MLSSSSECQNKGPPVRKMNTFSELFGPKFDKNPNRTSTDDNNIPSENTSSRIDDGESFQMFENENTVIPISSVSNDRLEGFLLNNDIAYQLKKGALAIESYIENKKSSLKENTPKISKPMSRKKMFKRILIKKGSDSTSSEGSTTSKTFLNALNKKSVSESEAPSISKTGDLEYGRISHINDLSPVVRLLDLRYILNDEAVRKLPAENVEKKLQQIEHRMRVDSTSNKNTITKPRLKRRISSSDSDDLDSRNEMNNSNRKKSKSLRPGDSISNLTTPKQKIPAWKLLAPSNEERHKMQEMYRDRELKLKEKKNQEKLFVSAQTVNEDKKPSIIGRECESSNKTINQSNIPESLITISKDTEKVNKLRAAFDTFQKTKVLTSSDDDKHKDVTAKENNVSIKVGVIKKNKMPSITIKESKSSNIKKNQSNIPDSLITISKDTERVNQLRAAFDTFQKRKVLTSSDDDKHKDVTAMENKISKQVGVIKKIKKRSIIMNESKSSNMNQSNIPDSLITISKDTEKVNKLRAAFDTFQKTKVLSDDEKHKDVTGNEHKVSKQVYVIPSDSIFNSNTPKNKIPAWKLLRPSDEERQKMLQIFRERQLKEKQDREKLFAIARIAKEDEKPSINIGRECESSNKMINHSNIPERLMTISQDSEKASKLRAAFDTFQKTKILSDDDKHKNVTTNEHNVSVHQVDEIKQNEKSVEESATIDVACLVSEFEVEKLNKNDDNSDSKEKEDENTRSGREAQFKIPLSPLRRSGFQIFDASTLGSQFEIVGEPQEIISVDTIPDSN